MGEAVSEALTELKDALANILAKVQQHLPNMLVDDFVDQKVGGMFGGAQAYKQCFTRLCVPNRPEMEATIQKHYRYQDVQTGFDDLLETEKEWDDFLQGLDQKIKGQIHSVKVAVGDDAPVNLTLRDVRSDTDVTLKKYVGSESQAAFAAAGGRVLVVTFGVREGALKWLEETKLPYDMLMDPSRQLYEAFGLYRSVAQVWHTTTMMYYGEQMATGRDLPSPYEDVEDDVHQVWSTATLSGRYAAAMAAGKTVKMPTHGVVQEDAHQMGGDFIMSPEGKVTLSHCSEHPHDRPSIEQLLTVLKKQ